MSSQPTREYKTVQRCELFTPDQKDSEHKHLVDLALGNEYCHLYGQWIRETHYGVAKTKKELNAKLYPKEDAKK